jgi:hypothetical protein
MRLLDALFRHSPNPDRARSVNAQRLDRLEGEALRALGLAKDTIAERDAIADAVRKTARAVRH